MKESMARRSFNLDLLMCSSFTMLVHGIRASGKTHFLGDLLATEKEFGKVCFINMIGEDGAASAKSFNLGDVGEDHESYDDFKSFCKEFTGKKLQAVGLDSLSVLGRWVMRATVGSDRLPRVTKDSNEWGEFHREMDNAMVLLRNTAKFVVAVCPSDRSVDMVTQRTYISPDLSGRQATGCAGWFDFVGYMQADVIGPGDVSRKFLIAPNSAIVVRQRLSKAITDDILLPKGPGAWAKIKNTIIEHGK